MSKKQTAPSGQRASRMGTGPPADGDTERAKAMGKKNPRQAHAESDAPAERAEGQDGKNDLVAVVGVGASAGGLEAFRQLLKRLPVDTGMAIVLITHLDPRHESILPDLVAKATPLPVSEAEEGMRVTPNHVYVMPRNTSMAIEGGALRLWPREKGRSQHRPIDAFLRTLAEDQNTSAIGIILSGTATDGTLGLEAVKAEGGITFAQEPKSAQYDSMPRSAIAAGCVDFVLTPEEIALELTRISRHPYVVPAEIAERGEPVPGHPDQRDQFLPRPGYLRSLEGENLSPDRRASRAGRAGENLGGRLFDRRGSLLHRHGFLGIPRRTRQAHPRPDFRHRPQRKEYRESARRPLFEEHRGGRLAGAIAPLLH